MQVSHTGLAGQALQMAHWLGSQDKNRSEARPGSSACAGLGEGLKTRLTNMKSIYCHLLTFSSFPFIQNTLVNLAPPHHGFEGCAALGESFFEDR